MALHSLRVLRSVAASGALLLGATGCLFNPPHAKLHVAVDNYPADVLYGALTQALPPSTVAPVLTPLLNPAAPTPVASPPATLSPPVFLHLPSACAALSPLAPVLHAAANRATTQPLAATYPWRSVGSESVSSSSSSADNAAAVNIPLVESRAVSDTSTKGHHIYFTVTATYPSLKEKQATSFDITTTDGLSQSLNPLVGELGYLEGIAITKVVTTLSTGSSSFTPVPEMQILQFPASDGASWVVASVDHSTGTIEHYSAQDVGVHKVNACGTPLDAWTVKITKGSIIQAITSTKLPATTTFTETYQIAPQYGGLVVADSISQQTTYPAVNLKLNSAFTDSINVAPKAPAGTDD